MRFCLWWSRLSFWVQKTHFAAISNFKKFGIPSCVCRIVTTDKQRIKSISQSFKINSNRFKMWKITQNKIHFCSFSISIRFVSIRSKNSSFHIHFAEKAFVCWYFHSNCLKSINRFVCFLSIFQLSIVFAECLPCAKPLKRHISLFSFRCLFPFESKVRSLLFRV